MILPAIPTDDFNLMTAQPVLTPKGYYLSVAPRVEVLNGQLIVAAFRDFQTLGQYVFAFDNTTNGSTGAVEVGMSVDFGTTPGARDIGTARVRATPTDVLFYISETAYAKLKLDAGVYFSVKDEFRPWLVLPLGREEAVNAAYINTITMFADYDTSYTDQNQNFRPKANITRSTTLALSPKPAGWVDNYGTPSETAYRTLSLSAFYSFCLGSSISSVVWDVKDCTIVSGSSTSSEITIRIPAGFRHIRLTVMAANGKTGTRVFPLWAHNNSFLPLSRFDIDNNKSADWNQRDLVFFQQDTSEVVIPKGTTLCQWEDDPFWGTSVPDQYRDQMYGWATQSVTLFRKDQSTATLTLSGVADWLDRYRSIPQRVQDPITRQSQSWFEMRDETLDKLAFYTLDNFSTANLVANLFVSGVTDLLPSLDITGNSLFDMVRYVMQGNFSTARSHTLNDIVLERNFQYLDATARAAITPKLTLTPAHWPDDSGPQITERGYDIVASILGSGAGFDGTTTTLYNASAPGRTPSDSNNQQDMPGQNLPASGAQDALNQITAAYFRVKNNDRVNIPMKLIHNLDCLEPGDIIALTDSDSQSGLTLDGDLFMVDEIDIAYGDRYNTGDNQGSSKVITLTLEGVIDATSADDADEVDVPVDTTDPPDYTPPTEIPPVTTTPSPLPPAYDGSDSVVPTRLIIFDYGGAHCHVATGWNPGSGSLVYTDASSGLGGSNFWATADPFNYARYFALQSDGLYRTDNPFGGASWTKIADLNSLFGTTDVYLHLILGSINQRGWFAIPYGGNMILITEDYFATWHTYRIFGGADDSGAHSHAPQCVAVYPYSASGAIKLFATANDYDGGSRLYKSSDSGKTWTQINAAMGVNTFNAAPGINIPYVRDASKTPNHDDGSLLIYAAGGNGNRGDLMASTDGGTTFNYEWSVNASNALRASKTLYGWAMQSFTWNGDKIGINTAHGTGQDFRIADTLGANQIFQSTNLEAAAISVECGHINGFPVNSQAWLVWFAQNDANGNRIFWTVDDGTSIGSAAAPTGYAGVSYVEWNIATLVH